MKNTLASLALVAALTPAFAHAHQPRCTMDGASLITNLQTAWGEVAQGTPLMVTPTVIEQLYANEDHGNWTRLSVGADGSACIQAAGSGFNGIDPSRALQAPLPARQEL